MKSNFEMSEIATRNLPASARSKRAIFDKRPLEKIPKINLNHLKLITDSVGIFQHANYNTPNLNEGYTTDDNARALILTVSLENIVGNGLNKKEINELSIKYLSFLNHAFNENNRRFRNFMNYDRTWIELESGPDGKGSEDSHARSIWALGFASANTKYLGLRDVSRNLLKKSIMAVSAFENPRPWAFSLIGISEYLSRFFENEDNVYEIGNETAKKLMRLYKKNSSQDWKWFEDKLTYSNAKLPHALIVAGKTFDNDEMINIGLESLLWLDNLQTDSDKGYFIPICNKGWYKKNGERVLYDQQPLEAQETISAYLEAYNIIRNDYWRERAFRVFGWFIGDNSENIRMYNPSTGGCFDGLMENNINKNQGAESTLAVLISLAELNYHYKNDI